MSRKTGGYFFARPFSKEGNFSDAGQSYAQTGATLHDVYTGLAMHALLSANPDRRFSVKEIAVEALNIADAMLAERAK